MTMEKTVKYYSVFSTLVFLVRSASNLNSASETLGPDNAAPRIIGGQPVSSGNPPFQANWIVSIGECAGSWIEKLTHESTDASIKRRF